MRLLALLLLLAIAVCEPPLVEARPLVLHRARGPFFSQRRKNLCSEDFYFPTAAPSHRRPQQHLFDDNKPRGLDGSQRQQLSLPWDKEGSPALDKAAMVAAKINRAQKQAALQRLRTRLRAIRQEIDRNGPHSLLLPAASDEHHHNRDNESR
eukprot:m.65575 g.65575  ORF g.65575 m.65575 type:complete len:152 (-) comp16501_c0_seq2:93-548(-)